MIWHLWADSITAFCDKQKGEGRFCLVQLDLSLTSTVAFKKMKAKVFDVENLVCNIQSKTQEG